MEKVLEDFEGTRVDLTVELSPGDIAKEIAPPEYIDEDEQIRNVMKDDRQMKRQEALKFQ